jgi:RNA-directed DNA polymerase
MSVALLRSSDELRSGFFALSTPQGVAALLDVDYKHLIYYLYIVPTCERYTCFTIAKRSGGERRICTPATALKIVQAKLNQVLQRVYEPKACVHGFAVEKSIVTNASVHSRKRYVLNADLENFFPSINFGRVRGMFMAAPYKLNPSVATVLAQICCFDNQLPQGAPSSPVVSNMICAKLDSQLQRLAQRNRCTYTRYADDLAFSTSMPSFPEALATVVSGPDGKRGNLGAPLLQAIIANGFQVNIGKVRLLTRNQRQEVTGLTANQWPNVRRRYVRQIRAMLHAWRRFGLEAAEQEFLSQYDKKSRSPYKNAPSFGAVVKGKIEYLGMVRGKTHPLYLKLRQQLKLTQLLGQFEAQAQSNDPQGRGFQLEALLHCTFRHFGMEVCESFRRNEGAEQIDGAFKLEAWYYILECRWRNRLAGIAELDGLLGKVNRSGKQTMGVFVSINGWSGNIPSLLKQNPEKRIFLMNGDDLKAVLSGRIGLRELILRKVDRLNLSTEPFYSASEILANSAGVTH